MPETALERCCAALSEALPQAMERAIGNLNAGGNEAELQARLTTIERLMKVAKLVEDGMAKSDPEGRTVGAVQMRGMVMLMTEHVLRIADRSPHGERFRELLE